MDRRGHCDDEHVRGLRRGAAAELSGLDRGLDERIEVALADVRAACRELADDALIRVQPIDVEAARGEHAGGGKPDVAEADDTHRRPRHRRVTNPSSISR